MYMYIYNVRAISRVTFSAYTPFFYDLTFTFCMLFLLVLLTDNRACSSKPRVPPQNRISFYVPVVPVPASMRDGHARFSMTLRLDRSRKIRLRIWKITNYFMCRRRNETKLTRWSQRGVAPRQSWPTPPKKSQGSITATMRGTSHLI